MLRCNCWAVASGFQCEVIGSLGFHTCKRWLCFSQREDVGTLGRVPYQLFPGYSFILPYISHIYSVHGGIHGWGTLPRVLTFSLWFRISFVTSTSQEKAEMRKMQVIVTAVWEPQFFGRYPNNPMGMVYVYIYFPRFTIKIWAKCR